MLTLYQLITKIYTIITTYNLKVNIRQVAVVKINALKLIISKDLKELQKGPNI